MSLNHEAYLTVDITKHRQNRSMSGQHARPMKTSEDLCSLKTEAVSSQN